MTSVGSGFLDQLKRPTVLLKILTFSLLAGFSANVDGAADFGACGGGDPGWVDEAFVGVRFLGITAAVVSALDVALEMGLTSARIAQMKEFPRAGSADRLIVLFHEVADLGTVTITSVIVHAITLCSSFGEGANMAAALALLAIATEVLTKDNDENSRYSFTGALRKLLSQRALKRDVLGRLGLLALLFAALGTFNEAATDVEGVPEEGTLARNFVCVDSARGLLDPLGAQTLTIVAIGSEILSLVFLLNLEKRNPVFHYLTTGVVVSVIHTGLVCGGLTLDDNLGLLLGEVVAVGLLILQTRQGEAAKVTIGQKVQKYRAVDLVHLEEA